jgi:phospholipid transport system substrate-binding protein
MFDFKISMLAGLTGLALIGTAMAEPGDPVAMIKKKDAELQKMLRDKEAKKKTDKLKALINGIFDFEELGKRALGPEIWKTMTPDQQGRFVKAFKGMVENASVKKLEVYQSDSTTYEAPDLKEGKATVTSHMFSKGTESIVTYKLQVKDSTWKAWDLVIDDLSTARNYGEQFRKILQTSDMNGLIAKLEKKSSGGSEAKPTDSIKAKSEKGATTVKTAPKAAPSAKP